MLCCFEAAFDMVLLQLRDCLTWARSGRQCSRDVVRGACSKVMADAEHGFAILRAATTRGRSFECCGPSACRHLHRQVPTASEPLTEEEMQSVVERDIAVAVEVLCRRCSVWRGAQRGGLGWWWRMGMGGSGG